MKVWDAKTGKELVSLQGHRSWVWCVAFSPDGQVLATGGNDRTIKLWDVATWQQTATLRCLTGPVRSLAFSPDGQTLAVGSSSLELWDLATGTVRQTLQVNEEVHCVAFSPDGTKLASTSAWHTSKTKLWNLATAPPQLIHEWRGAWAVAFSPDGTRLAATSDAGWNRTLRILDVATKAEIAVYDTQVAEISAVAYSPDGKTLAMGCYDRTVRLWEPETGKSRTMAHLNQISGVRFSPDGKTLASVSFDKTIKLWDVNLKPDELTIQGHKAGRAGIAFSPDGKTLAYSANDRTIRICNPVTGETQATFDCQGDFISWVTFSRDSRHLAAGSLKGPLKLWDVVTREELASIDNPHGALVHGALARRKNFGGLFCDLRNEPVGSRKPQIAGDIQSTGWERSYCIGLLA